jgi:hypothetical protein
VGPFASPFVECYRRHSVKGVSLLSVRTTGLGKEALPVPRYAFFVKCYGHGTRQSTSLSNPFLFVFNITSKQTKDIYH